MARKLRVEQRRPGGSEDRRAVEEGDAGDLSLDCPAVADAQCGQREHVAVSVAVGKTQKVAVHEN